MYYELERKMLDKGLNSIGVNFAINNKGDFIMFPKDKGEKYYVEGNINKVDEEALSSYIMNLMKMSLNRDEAEDYKNVDDKFHDFELAEYKKDKCKSMKYITINISKIYPEKVLLVDMVNLGKFEWGGGRYMHFFPIESKCSEIVDLLKKIYEYKGHMAGATSEQKDQYRKI